MSNQGPESQTILVVGGGIAERDGRDVPALGFWKIRRALWYSSSRVVGISNRQHNNFK